MGYTLNFAVVWRNFDRLLEGLALSLGLALVSILIGAAIGLAVAFALISKYRAASWPATAYVTLIRNLPILVLVLFAYFALPQMGVRLDKIESFVIDIGFDDFELVGTELFRGFVVFGGALVVTFTVFAVLLALLFNLISDVVGGIRLTVIEPLLGEVGAARSQGADGD